MFILFLKHQKLFDKEAKLFFFFIRNLRASCIYFLQVLKIKIWGHLPFARIACKIYFRLKNCPLIMIDSALWKRWELGNPVSYLWIPEIKKYYCFNPNGGGGDQSVPLVRRLAPISHRIKLWSQKFLILSINIPTRRW